MARIDHIGRTAALRRAEFRIVETRPVEGAGLVPPI